MPAYNNSARSNALDPTSAPVANPSGGLPVIMSPFSGPKGSPFDMDKNMAPDGTLTANAAASTGALSTGIGFGLNTDVPGIDSVYNATTGIAGAGFDLNEFPGLTMPDGSAAPDARLLAIGGGRCNAPTIATNGIPVPNPYVAQPLLAFGGGSSRDAGAGPAFTGFGMKTLQAGAAVADGAVIATGFTNRSGVTLPINKYQHASNTTASPAVT